MLSPDPEKWGGGNASPPPSPTDRRPWWRGHEDQGAVWTGSVRRVQSKCWSDTGERLEPIVVYRCCGTDKQKDLYKKSYSKNYILYAGGLAVVEDGEANLQ